MQFVQDIKDRPVTFDVQLMKRRKSRIGINFEAADRVRLEAPARTTLEELQAMVSAHERWFFYRLQRVAEESPAFLPPAYAHGELVLHHGEPLQLRVCFDGKARPRAEAHESGALRLYLPGELHNPEPLIRRLVRSWQSQQAKLLFAERLEQLVADIEWVPSVPSWRVQFMRSQWGSCNSSGHLALNTHMVKLPTALVDYVLVHELCHLKHMNHGKRFQGLMDKHQPDWRDRQTELNRYGGLLAEL